MYPCRVRSATRRCLALVASYGCAIDRGIGALGMNLPGAVQEGTRSARRRVETMRVAAARGRPAFMKAFVLTSTPSLAATWTTMTFAAAPWIVALPAKVELEAGASHRSLGPPYPSTTRDPGPKRDERVLRIPDLRHDAPGVHGIARATRQGTGFTRRDCVLRTMIGVTRSAIVSLSTNAEKTASPSSKRGTTSGPSPGPRYEPTRGRRSRRPRGPRLGAHAEQQDDQIDVDRCDGALRTDDAEQDHERRAEHRRPAAPATSAYVATGPRRPSHPYRTVRGTRGSTAFPLPLNRVTQFGGLTPAPG